MSVLEKKAAVDAPKISVIIPAYQVVKTLRRCVDSVTRQTFTDIEIILVDDGSTDGTAELCDQLSLRDSRIRVIHKENGGLGWARNTGIKAARGGYVSFIDSDDYIDLGMLMALFRAITKERADAAFCGRVLVTDGVITGNSILESKFTCWSSRNEVKEFLMKQIATRPEELQDSDYGATVTNGLFSMKVIEENEILFESEKYYVSEDGLFDIDFAAHANKVVCIPECLYYYVYNLNSLTSSYDKDHFNKTLALYRIGRQKLLNGFQDPGMIQQYKRMFIAASRVCLIQEAKHCSYSNLFSTLARMKKICKNINLSSVLTSYPWQKFPLKKRFFTFLMKHKLVVLQLIIVKAEYR